jgi:hypothetical protein
MIASSKFIQTKERQAQIERKIITIEPPQSFESMLFNLDEELFGLLMRCIIDRIPILIVGIDFDYIHKLAFDIANLIEFRKVQYFGIDFNQHTEYEDFMKEEQQNCVNKRYQFICRSDFLNDAMAIIPNFKSWILCHEYIGEETLIKQLFRIHAKAERFLLIHVNYKQKEEIERSQGTKKSTKYLFEIEFKLKGKLLDKSLVFETGIKRLIEKSIDAPRTAISRLIKQSQSNKSRVFLNEFDHRIYQSLLLQLKGELYGLYVETSTILPILDFLVSKQKNGDLQISDRIPLKLVNKSVASNQRILEFIQSEWDRNYALEFLNGDDKLDLIESLWE